MYIIMEKLRENYRNLERFYAEDMNKMTHIINSLSDNAQVFISPTNNEKIVGEIDADIKIGDVVIDDGSVNPDQKGFIYKVENIEEAELNDWIKCEFSSLTPDDDTVMCAKYTPDGTYYAMNTEVKSGLKQEDGILVTVENIEGVETITDGVTDDIIVNVKPSLEQEGTYNIWKKEVDGEAPRWLSVRNNTTNGVSFCDDETITDRSRDLQVKLIVTGTTAYTVTEIVINGEAEAWLSFKPSEGYFKSKDKIKDSDVKKTDFCFFAKKSRIVTVVTLSTLNDGSGGGSDVTWDQYQGGGVNIARIGINGNYTNVYAPQQTTVSWSQNYLGGTQIASININGSTTYIYAPNGVGTLMSSVTYSHLVVLRKTNSLVPGLFYRITDYMTTTTQEGTRSAGHPFDVVVRAISTNTLSEEAYAAKSTRDTSGYFSYCNLNAWKLWYCLDNDTTRFSWADESNGKGVIYRMIDENNNDVPYDFKNIQFIRYKVTGGSIGSPFYNTWQGPWLEGTTVSDYKYHYTFTRGDSNYPNNSTTYDSTVYNILEDRAANNTIKRCSLNNKEEYEYKQGYQCAKLNNIVFIANFYSFDSCFGFEDWTYENIQTLNTFEHNCYNMTFNGVSEGNRFLNDCYNFSFASSSFDNSFGAESNNNSLIGAKGNKVGNGFSNNKINRFANYNTIGNDFTGNLLGSDFDNLDEHEFIYNVIGNNFYSNTIFQTCEENIIGNTCHSNSFLELRQNNIGNRFNDNQGVYFSHNTVGNLVYRNNFPNSFYYSNFGDYVQYLNFAANYSNLRFIQIQNGGFNKRSIYSVPAGIVESANYQQTVGINNSGNFVVKNLLN